MSRNVVLRLCTHVAELSQVGAAATMFGRKITVTRSEGTYTIFPHEVADQHNDLHIK